MRNWYGELAVLICTGLLSSSCGQTPKQKLNLSGQPEQAIINVMGMDVSFDVSAGDMDTTQKLMTDFGRAFTLRDKDALKDLTAPDFVWRKVAQIYQHKTVNHKSS